jgi:hypothetical protein
MDLDMFQPVSFGDLLKVEAEKAQSEFKIQNDEFRMKSAEGVVQADESETPDPVFSMEEEHEREEEEILEAGGEMEFSENLSEMQQEAQLESQFEMQTDEGRTQHAQRGMETGNNPLERRNDEGSPDVFRDVQSSVREVRTVDRGSRNIFSAEGGEGTQTFREVESAFNPFEKRREEVGSHAERADGEMDISALKAFEAPAQIQTEESKARDLGGDAEVNIKPLETQMEMRGGEDGGQTFDGSGGNADSFSAEGLGQVTEMHVESESSVEPNFVVTEPEKRSNFDAVDEAAMGQAKPESIELVEQIISQVKPRFKNGETSMRLKLVPEDLGAIEIQMTSNELGVSLHFVTEQAATAQTLESQSGQLRQSLKEAGFQLTDLNISQQNQPKQEGGFFRQDRQFVQSPRRSVPQVGAEKVERTRPQRMIGSTHEIDYLV